jgi:hypothetical protein
MKIGNHKIRKRHVKKAFMVTVYAITAIGMVAWTVFPSFGL